MFITFEGADGSGKTTILNLLSEELKNEGFNILTSREPGGVKISEEIRKILLDKENVMLDDKTEALLFAASRRQHLIEKVIPALKEGKIVLCDRYIDSSLAYQGAGKNIGIEKVLNINLFAIDDLLPDLTLLFDCPPEIGLSRINQNSSREVNRLDLEKLDFYIKVRNAYLELAKKYKDRFVIIDASKNIEDVYKETYKIIKEKLK